jgi:uncharacterized DUF497 family protein
MRIDFDWDPAKAASNAAKHGVTFQEAMTVFVDPFARAILDPDHSTDEERWVTMGEASTGNLVVVVHTWNETTPSGPRCALSRRAGQLRARGANTARNSYEF